MVTNTCQIPEQCKTITNAKIEADAEAQFETVSNAKPIAGTDAGAAAQT